MGVVGTISGAFLFCSVNVIDINAIDINAIEE